jgi:hypothetical protein
MLQTSQSVSEDILTGALATIAKLILDSISFRNEVNAVLERIVIVVDRPGAPHPRGRSEKTVMQINDQHVNIPSYTLTT